jgi:hypothetical protein
MSFAGCKDSSACSVATPCSCQTGMTSFCSEFALAPLTVLCCVFLGRIGRALPIRRDRMIRSSGSSARLSRHVATLCRACPCLTAGSIWVCCVCLQVDDLADLGGLSKVHISNACSLCPAPRWISVHFGPHDNFRIATHRVLSCRACAANGRWTGVPSARAVRAGHRESNLVLCCCLFLVCGSFLSLCLTSFLISHSFFCPLSPCYAQYIQGPFLSSSGNLEDVVRFAVFSSVLVCKLILIGASFPFCALRRESPCGGIMRNPV